MRASSTNRAAAADAGGVPVVQDLDGHLAVQGQVAGAIDDAHAAAADLARAGRTPVGRRECRS